MYEYPYSFIRGSEPSAAAANCTFNCTFNFQAKSSIKVQQFW